jgi:hypothetical protein
MSDINEINTFINLNGKPIIRRCENCTHWKQIEEQKNGEPVKVDSGYCKRVNIFFAYTLEPVRNYISRKCDLCVNHEFYNEAELEKTAEKINLQKVVSEKK